MLLGLLWPAISLFGQFGGGLGTQASPYQISTIVHLNNIRDSFLSARFIQMADIDMSVTNPVNVSEWVSGSAYSVGNFVRYSSSGFTYICNLATNSALPTNTAFWTPMWESAKGWKPIGDATTAFTGVYNGNGKVVSNLYINRKASPVADNVNPTDGEDNVGLFGFLRNSPSADAVIRNLGVLNPNVSGRRATGSLVGRNLLPYSTPAPAFTVIIENCYAIPSGGSATVSGFGATGGLVGANNSDRKQQVPVVRYSYANVTVSSTHPTNSFRNPNDETAVNGIFNPYNIKYGGLVGCNENGLTQDSFARGNVTGGDRVGGLVGCTISGAIFRSYSTGTVARGIAPGDWEGGIGGLVGRVVGKLPSGLGGTNSQANSVQDSYWDTVTSNFPTSPGGTGRVTSIMKTQSNFVNWDFVNVWGIDLSGAINNGYPYLRANPSSAFYYRSLATGGWNSLSSWEYSADNSIWNPAVVIPDHSNSLAITIRSPHTLSLVSDVIADQMTIASGGILIIPVSRTLTVFNGVGDDLTINGDLQVAGIMIMDLSSTLIINGQLTITGNLQIDPLALATAGPSSTITFNGSLAQNTGSQFPTILNNLILNNPAGVSFSNPLTINGTLSVLSGSYTGSGTPDGYHSPALNYLEIFETGSNISGFSAATANPNLFPNRINRSWNLSGTWSGAKTVRFYWTSADDNSYDWTGKTPAAWEGTAKFNATDWDLSANPRWIEVSSSSFAASKGSWTIGLNSEQTLPVELSSFTASASISNFALLQWITQSETNVSGFRIYRNSSPDLETAQILNVFIAATNSSQTQSYVYEDKEITSSGTWYYWLENVDLDGGNAIHGPVSVRIEATGGQGIPGVVLKDGIERVYPNPFNPSTTISYQVKSTAELKLEIFNSKGQLVRRLFSGSKSPGVHKVNWDGRDEQGRAGASGVYLLRAKIGNNSYQTRLTLSK